MEETQSFVKYLKWSLLGWWVRIGLFLMNFSEIVWTIDEIQCLWKVDQILGSWWKIAQIQFSYSLDYISCSFLCIWLRKSAHLLMSILFIFVNLWNSQSITLYIKVCCKYPQYPVKFVLPEKWLTNFKCSGLSKHVFATGLTRLLCKCREWNKFFDAKKFKSTW